MSAATRRITGEEALAGLERTVHRLNGRNRVAQRRPNERGRCRYTWNGQPDCLIGHYLATELGVTVGQLIDFDKSMNQSLIDLLISQRKLKPFVFTADAVSVLVIAQSGQDRLLTWGEVTRAAREFLRTGNTPW